MYASFVKFKVMKIQKHMIKQTDIIGYFFRG